MTAAIALGASAQVGFSVNQRPVGYVDPFSLPAGTKYAKDHIVVAFRPGVSPAVKSSLRARYGLTLDTVNRSDYFEIWNLPAKAVQAGLTVETTVRSLMDNPLLQFAEFDTALEPDFVPNDTNFAQQWGPNNTGQTGGTSDADIDAVEAWNKTLGDAQVVVADCDDGYDWAHNDLNDAIWMNPGEIAGNGIDDDGNGFIDDIRGWDFVQNDNNPAPSGGSHGTHTAGTIGAEFNNGLGVAGMGPNIRVMALRIYSSAAWMTHLTNAVDYAWRNGAEVISVSYNIDGYTTALFQAIQRAETADVIYCNSAGNNNQNNSTRSLIRTLTTNTIFIAASDHNDNKASFSNYGTRVDVFAPGVNVMSTLPGNTYGNNSGTSMSCPHAAGCLGVIRARYPQLTARQALDVLINTSDQKSSLSAYVPLGRRVNLNQATNYANVSGQVGLARFLGNAAAKPLTVQITNPGSPTVLSTFNLTVTTTGNPEISNFLVFTNQLGSKDVYFKYPGYLRRKVAGVSIAHPTTGLAPLLMIGDCDGDNDVDGQDALITRVANGSSPGHPRWDPRADVDGNLVVDIRDLRWVYENIGRVGD